MCWFVSRHQLEDLCWEKHWQRKHRPSEQPYVDPRHHGGHRKLSSRPCGHSDPEPASSWSGLRITPNLYSELCEQPVSRLPYEWNLLCSAPEQGRSREQAGGPMEFTRHVRMILSGFHEHRTRKICSQYISGVLGVRTSSMVWVFIGWWSSLLNV